MSCGFNPCQTNGGCSCCSSLSGLFRDQPTCLKDCASGQVGGACTPCGAPVNPTCSGLQDCKGCHSLADINQPGVKRSFRTSWMGVK